MKKPSKRVARTKSDFEEKFLKLVGAHCRKLRTNKGISIHKLARESEQLSTSVVQRLETGSGPVDLSSLMRYAEVLETHPKDLLDVPFDPHAPSSIVQVLIPNDDSQVKKDAFKKLLPVYSLKAAAGYFGSGEAVEALGWIEISGVGKLSPSMFIVQAKGQSMSPKISDGDYMILRARPVGTRTGKIVLAQFRGPADPDTGGSYTIKKYASKKDASGHNQVVTLSPLNPKFKPIVLHPENEDDFKILAEFVDVIRFGTNASI